MTTDFFSTITEARNEGRLVNLCDKRFENGSLENYQITDSYFERVEFFKMNFSAVTFVAIYFIDCQFIDCTFADDCSFYKTEFHNCRLGKCRFNSGEFNKCEFHSTHFSINTWEKWSLDWSFFFSSDLRRNVFFESSLKGTIFSECKLFGFNVERIQIDKDYLPKFDQIDMSEDGNSTDYGSSEEILSLICKID